MVTSAGCQARCLPRARGCRYERIQLWKYNEHAIWQHDTFAVRGAASVAGRRNVWDFKWHTAGLWWDNSCTVWASQHAGSCVWSRAGSTECSVCVPGNFGESVWLGGKWHTSFWRVHGTDDVALWRSARYHSNNQLWGSVRSDALFRQHTCWWLSAKLWCTSCLRIWGDAST